MTREEAIKAIEEASEYFGLLPSEFWYDGKYPIGEAIDMAIEALQGGDAEIETPQNYMQKSRQADMMLVDLNSKDGYLLDGKYKVNGCEDLTDGRVDVVRCKDCRYWKNFNNAQGICHERPNIITTEQYNDFCSHGERRE